MLASLGVIAIVFGGIYLIGEQLLPLDVPVKPSKTDRRVNAP